MVHALFPTTVRVTLLALSLGLLLTSWSAHASDVPPPDGDKVTTVSVNGKGTVDTKLTWSGANTRTLEIRFRYFNYYTWSYQTCWLEHTIVKGAKSAREVAAELKPKIEEKLATLDPQAKVIVEGRTIEIHHHSTGQEVHVDGTPDKPDQFPKPSTKFDVTATAFTYID